MTLSIMNVQTDRLEGELARATGESITDAVTEAIRQRLSSVTGRRNGMDRPTRADRRTGTHPATYGRSCGV